jgi:hypothetical protein
LAKDEHRDPADLDDAESSHAADEPTAVWDMEALRKAGLGELANLPEAPESVPATPAEGMQQQRPSIIVNEAGNPAPGGPAAPAGGAASQAKQPPRVLPAADATPSSGSWWSLVGMALVLGVVAYLAIRLLR